MSHLSGRVAVVTGASKGIGAAIAKMLAAHGASVVVNYSSSKEAAEKVVAEVTKANGKAVAVGANIAKPEEIEKLFAETIKAFGKVDILINNAGAYSFTPLETLTADIVNSMFAINVTGLLLTTKAAVGLFPTAGGSIVNIGSVVAEIAPGMASVYAGTKGALNTITRVLAKELAPKKIRVNAVNPGAVLTEGFQSAGFAGSEFEQQMVASTPLGRIGQPNDIASVVTFLVSDDSGWVSKWHRSCGILRNTPRL